MDWWVDQMWQREKEGKKARGRSRKRGEKPEEKEILGPRTRHRCEERRGHMVGLSWLHSERALLLLLLSGK